MHPERVNWLLRWPRQISPARARFLDRTKGPGSIYPPELAGIEVTPLALGPAIDVLPLGGDGRVAQEKEAGLDLPDGRLDDN